MYLLIAIVLATVHQLHPQVTLILYQRVSLSQFTLFQHSKKSIISNAVISVLIATVKNNEVPGTFEAVLNYLLVADGLLQFKMGNVTPPSSFSSTSTDYASLNTQSTSTPSPLPLADKPSLSSTDDHSAPAATIYKKKTAENQQRKIYQSSLVKTGSSSSRP